jgi:sugar phosphate permease
MLVPFSLAVVPGAALAAPAMRWLRPQPTMAAGLAVIAVAEGALPVAPGGLLSVTVAVAGAGLGLSSVAATTLGTTVPDAVRGTASGIINTAAQLGTAIGIAVVLLIAAATTGVPGPGTAPPAVAWAVAAATAAAGALVSARSPRQGIAPSPEGCRDAGSQERQVA